jgi:hypothetical protein
MMSCYNYRVKFNFVKKIKLKISNKPNSKTLRKIKKHLILRYLLGGSAKSGEFCISMQFKTLHTFS